MKLEEKIEEIVKPTIEKLGYNLYDVILGSEEGRFALIIKIDKKGGVTVEDCAQVSREIDPLLEKANLIKNSWVLIVSSPGVE